MTIPTVNFNCPHLLTSLDSSGDLPIPSCGDRRNLLRISPL
ncbi:hypothetical protein [Coleofasciculus sp. E1-EBD-02]